MDNQAALTLIRDILAPRKLSPIEELVICHSWEGKRYREMALLLGYEEGYLKDTGSRLWQSLSSSLGYPISKKRLRYALTEMVAQPQDPETATGSLANASENLPAKVSPTVLLPLPAREQSLEAPGTALSFGSLEYPGSPLSFGSLFYIERSPVEEWAISALQYPGGLLRIKAPWRMGKTSLINHLLGKCEQLGQATVVIDMRQADTPSLENLDAFFRWFCWSINQQLDLTWELDKYWFEDAGSKLNCTTYMQEHILAQISSSLVIALDTCHALIDHPVIASNFFSMLRSWYEQAKVRPQWQKLRLALAHVDTLDLPVHAHQSPFNVGLQVKLTALTWQQIHDLSARYSLGEIRDQEAVELESLVELVGGNPYLMQLAFYWLKSGQFSLAQILQAAATNGGIYREYLRGLWRIVQRKETSIKALRQVLLTPEPTCLSSEQANALADIGLVDMMGHQVKLRCELYRSYFSSLVEIDGG